jgi:hypothetical protein
MTIVIDNPDAIMHFHMLAQKHALRMEIAGLKFKGGSVCAHIKRTYGITARRKADVLVEFTALIDRTFPNSRMPEVGVNHDRL